MRETNPKNPRVSARRLDTRHLNKWEAHLDKQPVGRAPTKESAWKIAEYRSAPVESNFHTRKAERKEHFEKYVKGWRLQTCTACSGSGHYDHNGAPRCSNCNGTGKERFKFQPESDNTTSR